MPEVVSYLARAGIEIIQQPSAVIHMSNRLELYSHPERRYDKALGNGITSLTQHSFQKDFPDRSMPSFGCHAFER